MAYNYNFIIDEHTRLMVQTASDAVTKLDLWDFYRNFTQDSEKGFMYDNNPQSEAVYTEVEKVYNGHSGASFGFILRHIEYIAKNGIEAYKAMMTPGTGATLDGATQNAT